MRWVIRLRDVLAVQREPLSDFLGQSLNEMAVEAAPVFEVNVEDPVERRVSEGTA